MNEHEQIIINNFTAQYNSIRGEIAVVNGELAQKLLQKERLIQDCSSVTKDIADAKDTLTTLFIEQQRVKDDTASRQAACLEQEAATKEDRILFESFKASATADLAEQRAKLVSDISEKETYLASLSEKNTELEDAIAAAEQSKSIYATDLEDLHDQRRALLGKVEDTQFALSAAEKELTDKTVQIASAAEELAQAKALVANPLRAVQDREAAVARRERNAEIMRRRLKKQFEAMYPGKDLNI